MSDKFKNYYSILNLPLKATEAEIKRAYKQLAFQYHPDRAGVYSISSFHDVKEAYETLIDRKSKGDYDLKLSRLMAQLNRAKSKRPIRHNLAFVANFIGKKKPRFHKTWTAPLKVTIARDRCPVCKGYGVKIDVFNLLVFCKTCFGTGRRKEAF
ncbi:hypothetical protein MNBD_NITROSPINAE02-2031 [hydrothermal vent metagenome]|uniref:J domain-containing protein n=1 Tax=hydrothermal vent metagenome TaxID=652676 RepID=A0A3B1CDP1_9ZZZZ